MTLTDADEHALFHRLTEILGADSPSTLRVKEYIKPVVESIVAAHVEVHRREVGAAISKAECVSLLDSAVHPYAVLVDELRRPGGLSTRAVRVRPPRPDYWSKLTFSVHADEGFDNVQMPDDGDALTALCDGLRATLGAKGTFSIGGVRLEP